MIQLGPNFCVNTQKTIFGQLSFEFKTMYVFLTWKKKAL